MMAGNLGFRRVKLRLWIETRYFRSSTPCCFAFRRVKLRLWIETLVLPLFPAIMGVFRRVKLRLWIETIVRKTYPKATASSDGLNSVCGLKHRWNSERPVESRVQTG